MSSVLNSLQITWRHLSSAKYIERPPEGYMPEGFKPGEGKTIKADMSNIDANASSAVGMIDSYSNFYVIL